MVPDIGGGSDWTWMLVSILIFVNQHGHLLVVATCVGAVCGHIFPHLTVRRGALLGTFVGACAAGLRAINDIYDLSDLLLTVAAVALSVLVCRRARAPE